MLTVFALSPDWNGGVVRDHVDDGGDAGRLIVGRRVNGNHDEQAHDDEAGQRARHFADARVARVDLGLQNLEERDVDERTCSERL